MSNIKVQLSFNMTQFKGQSKNQEELLKLKYYKLYFKTKIHKN